MRVDDKDFEELLIAVDGVKKDLAVVKSNLAHIAQKIDYRTQNEISDLKKKLAEPEYTQRVAEASMATTKSIAEAHKAESKRMGLESAKKHEYNKGYVDAYTEITSKMRGR